MSKITFGFTSSSSKVKVNCKTDKAYQSTSRADGCAAMRLAQRRLWIKFSFAHCIMLSNGISIVIRTFNSGKMLGQVLERLKLSGQDQVIVVDSGSGDTTIEIAKRYGAKIVFVEGPFNYSKSLNIGFKAAKNDWVLVISSHAVPIALDFLDNHRRAIEAFPQNVVVGYAPATFSGKSDANIPVGITLYSPQDFSSMVRICGNGNTIYRKTAWKEYQFDETIRTTEDKLWLSEMTSRGYGFAYVSDARCLSRNQGSWNYMFRKGYSDSRAARDVNFTPVRPWHFAGTIKNIIRAKCIGELDIGSCWRLFAHAAGQFIGSYLKENNSPDFKR